MLIEQAVFTSARTDRARGYHLVAGSPGIRVQDARQLSALGRRMAPFAARNWMRRASIFIRWQAAPFAFCAAAAGAEYSGRSGPRVYTQFFVVPAEVLARFANNPLAFLRAARCMAAEVVRSRAADSAGV